MLWSEADCLTQQEWRREKERDKIASDQTKKADFVWPQTCEGQRHSSSFSLFLSIPLSQSMLACSWHSSIIAKYNYNPLFFLFCHSRVLQWVTLEVAKLGIKPLLICFCSSTTTGPQSGSAVAQHMSSGDELISLFFPFGVSSFRPQWMDEEVGTWTILNAWLGVLAALDLRSCTTYSLHSIEVLA